MANRIIDLPETKGKFEVVGKVFGTKKENFARTLKTRNGKNMCIVNFGVEYADGHNIYETLQGTENDYVYFSKKAEDKNEKPEVEKVKWADRHTFKRDGFRIIGKNIGVKKMLDKDGKEVNDKKVLVDFDAAVEVKDNLEDGKSVYTRGTLDFSSYTNDNGETRRSVKLMPDQISLCSDVDFNAEGFTPKTNFQQVIVFMEIDKERDGDKETGRAIVSAKIVNYNTIEDTEFIIEDMKLAALFRKNLKPFTAIKVSGHIISSTPTETVTDEDSWGESDEMEKVTAPTKREFIITGAQPSTIDKETYSKDKVESAIAAINASKKAESDFGSNTDTSDWGADDDDVEW